MSNRFCTAQPPTVLSHLCQSCSTCVNFSAPPVRRCSLFPSSPHPILPSTPFPLPSPLCSSPPPLCLLPPCPSSLPEACRASCWVEGSDARLPPQSPAPLLPVVPAPALLLLVLQGTHPLRRSRPSPNPASVCFLEASFTASHASACLDRLMVGQQSLLVPVQERQLLLLLLQGTRRKQQRLQGVGRAGPSPPCSQPTRASVLLALALAAAVRLPLRRPAP